MMTAKLWLREEKHYYWPNMSLVDMKSFLFILCVYQDSPLLDRNCQWVFFFRKLTGRKWSAFLYSMVWASMLCWSDRHSHSRVAGSPTVFFFFFFSFYFYQEFLFCLFAFTSFPFLFFSMFCIFCYFNSLLCYVNVLCTFLPSQFFFLSSETKTLFLCLQEPNIFMNPSDLQGEGSVQVMHSFPPCLSTEKGGRRDTFI